MTWQKRIRSQFDVGSEQVQVLGANIGERLMEDEAELFPKELMAQLPDLEYVGSFAGGKLVKGRLPILGVQRG